jgi:hypothetical protein
LRRRPGAAAPRRSRGSSAPAGALLRTRNTSPTPSVPGGDKISQGPRRSPAERVIGSPPLGFNGALRQDSGGLEGARDGSARVLVALPDRRAATASLCQLMHLERRDGRRRRETGNSRITRVSRRRYRR